MKGIAKTVPLQVETREQVPKVPLRNRIVDAVRDAIFRGDLEPGQALVEADLASDLGVSRGPIREALRTLAKDGLVQTVSYQGTRVRSLSQRDIEEVYSLRSLHETFAIKRIIDRGAHHRSDELWRDYDEMVQAGEAGDLRTLNSADERFHRTIILLADHAMLVEIWTTLSMRVRQIMALRNRTNPDLREVARNHIRIIEAIERGDAVEASSLIRRHVATAADLILAVDRTPS